MNKAKNALPDLSELLSPLPTNSANRDNRNLGLNEIGKDVLKNLPNASQIDAATPGMPGIMKLPATAGEAFPATPPAVSSCMPSVTIGRVLHGVVHNPWKLYLKCCIAVGDRSMYATVK